MNNTSFDTTCCYSTTTSDREHIFYWHQEWLIDSTWRKWNPSIHSFHKLKHLLFPLRITVKRTKSRTADYWSIVTIEFVVRKKLTHIHFYEFKHFFVINNVTLVHEDNKSRNVYLTSKKYVFASLRHRAISSSNHDDSTVHLSSTSYHVLHIVRVTWTVNVSIVTVSRLVLNV